MDAIKRYKELYAKALDQNEIGLAFEIAVELTQEEKRVGAENENTEISS